LVSPFLPLENGSMQNLHPEESGVRNGDILRDALIAAGREDWSAKRQPHARTEVIGAFHPVGSPGGRLPR
jgi:hypothetical protein